MSILHWRTKPSLVSHWEDVADWLNRFLTVIIVLILGICAIAYMYIVRPFACYLPDTINVVNQRYITDTCWSNFMTDERFQFTPYTTVKWVPTYVMFSVLGFYVPHTLWHHIADLLIDSVVKLLMKRLEIAMDMLDRASLDQATTDVANHLVKSIIIAQLDPTFGKNTRVKIRFISQLSFATRLKKGKMRIGIPWLRFILKTIYVINVILQLLYTRQLCVSRFGYLNDSYVSSHSSHLHTCKLSSTQIPSVVQCTLTGNLFLRETFYLYHTWLWFVMIVTVLGLLLWIVAAIYYSCRRVAWIKQRFLTVHACQSAAQEVTPVLEYRMLDLKDENVHMFVNLLTQTDGVAMLEIIDRRAGSDVTDQILLKCWQFYVKFTESRSKTSKSVTDEMQHFIIDESTT